MRKSTSRFFYNSFFSFFARLARLLFASQTRISKRNSNQFSLIFLFNRMKRKIISEKFVKNGKITKTNDEFFSFIFQKVNTEFADIFFIILSEFYRFQLTLLSVNRFTPSRKWNNLARIVAQSGNSTRLPLFRTSVRHFLQTDGIWCREVWQKQEDNLRSDGSTWQESRIIVVVVCARSSSSISYHAYRSFLFPFLSLSLLCTVNRGRSNFSKNFNKSRILFGTCEKNARR